MIINITSVAGTDAAAATSAMPYAVCKAGLNHMTKLLAKELGPTIRVNAIAPGLIKTPRTQDFKEAIDKFTERTPLKGETKEKRNAVRQFLKENHYRIAQVTVDFFEYEWNDPYVRCLVQNNQNALQWLRRNYIIQAKNALIIAKNLSTMLYGRDINHVLLIHINAFTAEMLDELLTAYEKQGVHFISLKEALSDRAYAFNPDIARERSYTFLNQVRLAKKLENPRSVRKLYDSFPEEKLAHFCNMAIR